MDQDATTFIALTDTPTTITADECVKGNTAGDALTFSACATGGGTGDITAVGTAANSGLAGGADSGDVDLIMDVANLVGQTNVAGGDHLPFDDTSASVTKRITVQNYAAHLFPTSGGLAPTTSGQGHVRLHGLPGLTTFEGSDELGLTDDSTSDNVTKKATLVHVVEHVAGPDFDVSTEAIMSLADGVSERLCPDPSTGTSGQVCARNAAGAYVLVTPSGGGGGGTSVDAVDVQFITNTRSIRVDVQQADGNDFNDSALIPLATDTVPGFTEHATNAEATAGTLTNRSLVPGNLASIFGSVISDTDINVASPSSESTAVGASRQAVAEAISDNGRRAHTTANPADIDGVADPGSGAAVNHPNHVHRLWRLMKPWNSARAGILASALRTWLSTFSSAFSTTQTTTITLLTAPLPEWSTTHPIIRRISLL